MHIRDYQPSDLPELVDLTIETFRPLFEHHLPPQLSDAVLAHDHGDSGRLQMVAVHPTAQHRGVGTAVCRSVLDRLRSRGVAVVHIGTGGDAFHGPARGLYESLGFTGYPVVDYTRAL